MLYKVVILLVAYYLGRSGMNLDDFLDLVKRLLGDDEDGGSA